MATIARATTWSTGDTLTADALNGEFNVVFNDYNGNITNANISATAAIATSKLAGTFPTGTIVGTTDTQTLTNKTLTSPTINTPTFSAGAIATADIADAAVTSRKMRSSEIQTANSSSAITTSSGSLVDLTGATVTWTPLVASTALVLFSGLFQNDTANQSVTVRLVVDGSVQAIPTSNGVINNLAGNGTGGTTSFMRWITGLGVSSHTIKIQWSVSGGTGTNQWFELIVMPFAS